MAKFELSAFTDEYSSSIDQQIEGMLKHGIHYTELRGVDGQNVSVISKEKAREVKAKLDSNGLAVWSIGSPLGKIKLTDDIEKHLELAKHCAELAQIFGTPRMRVFSFYVPDTDNISPYRGQVMDWMGRMLDVAKAEGAILCHENEKGIYGEKIEGCVDIQKTFGGEYKCIFDPANFLQSDVKPFPDAFDALGDSVYYMHIKDCNAAKTIVPAGKGLGGIPEILKELNKREGQMVLTLEPHLKVFSGLAALEAEGDESVIGNTYATSEEAFGAAVDALKAIIADI
ncbi:MAG: TIM barrel protein [Clostridia bacterium]|nr:TIM barrel protein [Clostridia bacterium]